MSHYLTRGAIRASRFAGRDRCLDSKVKPPNPFGVIGRVTDWSCARRVKECTPVYNAVCPGVREGNTRQTLQTLFQACSL